MQFQFCIDLDLCVDSQQIASAVQILPRFFKNWKQRACMIFVHQTNNLLEKVKMDKNLWKIKWFQTCIYITFYKLTQVRAICDSCPLSWIECLAISSILSPASWSLSLSMCLLSGGIFKDAKSCCCTYQHGWLL